SRAERAVRAGAQGASLDGRFGGCTDSCPLAGELRGPGSGLGCLPCRGELVAPTLLSSTREGASQMFASKQIAIGIVAAAVLTAGAGAYAFSSQQAPQKHQLRALGLGVMSVTPATREARVIVQCGDGQGELVTVKLPRRVD